jgi:hypothetical protein
MTQMTNHTNPMTYTIYNDDGRLQMGLNLAEAAHELLSADGYRYEWQVDDDAWLTLYTSHHSANSSGGPGKLSPTRYAGYDLREIFTEIVKRRWHGLRAMLDTDYDAMIAEFEMTDD